MINSVRTGPPEGGSVRVCPEDYLGLVYAAARRLHRSDWRRADLDEMVADGMVALVRLAQSYDLKHELPFASYAAPRIRWAIIDGRRSWYGARGRHPRKLEAAFEEPTETAAGVTDSAEEEALSILRAEEVRQVVSMLTGRQAEMAHAVMAEKGGQAALARHWGVTEGAVSVAIHRSPRGLRRKLRGLAS